MVGSLYGTGIRPGKLKGLQWTDAERANNRSLIRQGKDNKDRHTLLSGGILSNLEQFYRVYRSIRQVL